MKYYLHIKQIIIAVTAVEEGIGLGICTMHSDNKLQRLCKRNTNDGNPRAVLFVSYNFHPIGFQCILMHS